MLCTQITQITQQTDKNPWELSSDFLKEDLARSGIESVPDSYHPSMDSAIRYDIHYYKMLPENHAHREQAANWEHVKDNQGRKYIRSRLKEAGKNGQKYTQEQDSGTALYIPTDYGYGYNARASYSNSFPDDPFIYITEGEKKADAACIVAGFPCLAVSGIWNWTTGQDDYADPEEPKPVLPELLQLAKGKKLCFLYDSDCRNGKRRDFNECANSLARSLDKHGIPLYRVDLPELQAGSKTGLDDYIVHLKAQGLKQADMQKHLRNLPKRLVPVLWNSRKELYMPGVVRLLGQHFGRLDTDPHEPVIYFRRLDGKRIRIASPKEIEDWLSQYIERECPEAVYNYFLKHVGKVCDRKIFQQIPAETVRLHTDTKETIFHYFVDCVIAVTANGWKRLDYSEIDGLVMEERIVKQNAPLQLLSSIGLDRAKAIGGDWDTFIANISPSPAMRECLETGFGYCVQRHKCLANAKAIVLTDESMEEKAGGTGKGIILQALRVLRALMVSDFKTRRANQFLFQGVTAHHDVWCCEDLHQDFPWDCMYNAITGDMEIENKGQDRYSIPFEKSPKIMLSTNHALAGTGSSDLRRRHEITLSTHYSDRFTPMEEFGHMLLSSDWEAKEWEAFFVWAIRCCALYLAKGLVPCQSETLNEKRLEAETDRDFVDWMKESPLTPGTDYSTGMLLDGFKAFSVRGNSGGVFLVTERTLRGWIQKWASMKGYEVVEKRTAQARKFTIRKA